MNSETFDKLLQKELAAIEDTLSSKGKEYARGDRLSNFKRVAALNYVTPEKVCMILVSKHFVALADFVADLDESVTQPIEFWSEKIGDIQCYMILLKALVTEKLDGQ